MITVNVRFFGGREQFTRRITPDLAAALPLVSLADGATVDDLLLTLNLSTGEGRPLVSLNGFHQRSSVALADGDQVYLLKTVVGG
jgi:molybdopterin converting factor small subunit